MGGLSSKIADTKRCSRHPRRRRSTTIPRPWRLCRSVPLTGDRYLPKGMPPITSDQAYGAVLLYPDDETPIGELAAQPFVADYLEDLAEHDRMIGRLVVQANQVLIHNGDAVILNLHRV